MYAITSLLNPRNASRINRMVKGLETRFGLDDVQDTPDPHLTYLLTGTRRLTDLKQVLARSGRHHPALFGLSPRAWGCFRAAVRLFTSRCCAPTT